MSHLNTAVIVREILQTYRLPLRGYHGVTHWARVLENGLRLAAENGADRRIVTLFALFHDAARVNEDQDTGHGRRGADLAVSLHGKLFELEPAALELLVTACSLHEEGHTEGDLTIRTCWDADRLDLGRVGIRPLPHLLCTEAGRRPEVIDWAHRRAVSRREPEFVAGEWGIRKPWWRRWFLGS